jgi:hypothetical protein
MKWKHVQNERPKPNSFIIKLNKFGTEYKDPSKTHWALMMTYYEERVPWEFYEKWCLDNKQNLSDYWWVYPEELNFPGDNNLEEG